MQFALQTHLSDNRYTLQASLKHKRGLMVSPPDSIPILQLLLKLTNAKKVVEVGVFTGSSSLLKSFMAVICMEYGQ